MQVIKAEVHLLSERMDSGEASLSTLEHRVTALERSQTAHANTAVDLQLQLKDLENRSHRNNLRLQASPEATGVEDLAETIIAIFHKVLQHSWSWIESIVPSDLDRWILTDLGTLYAGCITTRRNNLSSVRTGNMVWWTSMGPLSRSSLISRATLQRALLHPIFGSGWAPQLHLQMGIIRWRPHSGKLWHPFTLHTPKDLTSPQLSRNRSHSSSQLAPDHPAPDGSLGPVHEPGHLASLSAGIEEEIPSPFHGEVT